MLTFIKEAFNSFSSRLILGLAIILIAGFQYMYWFGEGGYYDHQKLMQQIQQQEDTNKDLKERNRILGAEVYDLKNGAEAVEEHARLDLGLIKPNETFVQMSTLTSPQMQENYISPVESKNTDSEDEDSPDLH
ncbi:MULTISPECIES: cell division protein FtsB [Acinetobacter]|uniref:Cell division protein FtsB n=2 Tax=Gammaproteobacteria TaxID=1236 RepID=A0ABU6DS02_9GAMM|nr:MULTISPECIES: cell division protein FtsB [Acinetobacter]MBF7690477.1 cell division protein FtsB [Acinetobacter pollinis]MBF7692527.1 cell division protein FtsB [Acinetobacter pollinis]MBF7697518.1 cell division protein FtsB [Acinetobacter pollinis]MBF7699657.1 cell division protein FtsB [Acinetobacter pollinis]MEB5475894.1 cell division protein FtsB [Acinetobacter pollinis]